MEHENRQLPPAKAGGLPLNASTHAAGGVAVWGVAVLAIAAWPTPAVAWVVLAALGLGNAVEDVAGMMLLQRLIPDHRLERAFGAFWGTAGASVAAGSIAAPGQIAVVGLREAMALSGAALLVLVLAVSTRVRKADADEETDVRTENVHLLRRQPVLACG